ncbi:hypothetical protein M5K25_012385 [Dendrobium thyrsiflorum]|uniref:Uncharacterized protein n=1 Tax=Dendrobium thyrsiflorum TaxID=117978 RepID=A0ABD0UXT1_DENTH
MGYTARRGPRDTHASGVVEHGAGLCGEATQSKGHGVASRGACTAQVGWRSARERGTSTRRSVRVNEGGAAVLASCLTPFDELVKELQNLKKRYFGSRNKPKYLKCLINILTNDNETFENDIDELHVHTTTFLSGKSSNILYANPASNLLAYISIRAVPTNRFDLSPQQRVFVEAGLCVALEHDVPENGTWLKNLIEQLAGGCQIAGFEIGNGGFGSKLAILEEAMDDDLTLDLEEVINKLTFVEETEKPLFYDSILLF